MTNFLIIIPTYKEEENIYGLIKAILALDTEFDILVIDDNSPDNTQNIVEDLIRKWPGRVYLKKRPGKLGLGTAYLDGFNWALEHHYKYIFEMDADFSHNPDDLEKILETTKQDSIGMSVGSRYKKGVAIVNWPMGRLILSYYASMYVRTVTGMSVRDATAGFVCYKREVLEKLDLDKIRMKGYGFQIEMKFKTWKLGYSIAEVPVIFINREQGTSKMSGGIFSEALVGVLRMKISSLRGDYREYISRNYE
ncbi:MAG: polyprenol monophosphomannose synthase [Bacteroidetes bacterium]|nr:polyprenol monophosphomannose synthase [Bacteroidota bacterium]MBT3748280.1 polyprenol monophosphomannose synthase [Bacteroidota bacterium]MBT4399770.1 polyprenol monophosphomannose synthase [Bacteroidota bacterium]MBT4409143.1 polyprenol monophosphomannose synthase [Bacteroidota bacterium]MBT7462944.1 polyprenol monophosphomannose synthase [Bacteroidota bacterium]